MPEEKIVKTISVGGDTRYIGAKYDINGVQIDTAYAKTADIYTQTQANDTFLGKNALDNYVTKDHITNNQIPIKDTDGNETFYTIISEDTWAKKEYVDDNFINKDDAEGYISDTITELIETGEIEVKVPQTKKFSFKDDVTNLVLSAEEDYKQLLKIIVYQSSFSSTSETGIVALDGTDMQLDSSYFRPGATFEIYKTVLVCTNELGDRKVMTTANVTTDDSWSTFEFKNLTQSISVLVYQEGWIEATVEGGN